MAALWFQPGGADQSACICRAELRFPPARTSQQTSTSIIRLMDLIRAGAASPGLGAGAARGAGGSARPEPPGPAADQGLPSRPGERCPGPSALPGSRGSPAALPAPRGGSAAAPRAGTKRSPLPGRARRFALHLQALGFAQTRLCCFPIEGTMASPRRAQLPQPRPPLPRACVCPDPSAPGPPSPEHHRLCAAGGRGGAAEKRGPGPTRSAPPRQGSGTGVKGCLGDFFFFLQIDIKRKASGPHLCNATGEELFPLQLGKKAKSKKRKARVG